MPHTTVSAYPEYGPLIKRLSEFYGVGESSLMLTNGSDEALMVIANTFIEPGVDRAVVSKPCFIVIPHCLKLAGASVHEVPVKADLSFNIAGIENELQAGAKLAMFASPENPTGALLDVSQIKKWCMQYSQTLFVIDEAYGEYASGSMLSAVAEFDNLLVLKTFSKAWGMAGLRFGITFGNPSLIEYMLRVRLPYSVNSAAVWTVNRLLDQQSQMVQSVNSVKEEKARLCQELKKRGYQIDIGHSNSFLLGAGANAMRLTEHCKGQNVLVRNRSASQFPPELNGGRPVMWGKVRVSIGTPTESQSFLAALGSFDDSYGVIFDLDGTLVDTSTSFDKTVAELVERHSGRPLLAHELQSLRAEGGFNDDWVATHELLTRRGVDVSLTDITEEAVRLYLEIAKQNESMLCDLAVLEKIKSRHPIFIVTGRTREEYAPVWGERLDKLFERVYCLNDLPGKLAKPSPDYLQQVLADYKLKTGVYVGNGVDDMQAARAAGLDAIAVTTTLPAEILNKAGAQITLSSVNQLEEVYML